MNFQDWFTDLMDVYRNTPTVENNLTRHARVKVLEGIPCRIYSPGSDVADMTQTAADENTVKKMACDLSVEVHAGDEILITRGGRLGHTGDVIRGFAGDPEYYYEPFGAVMPGLAHQEIELRRTERIK